MTFKFAVGDAGRLSDFLRPYQTSHIGASDEWAYRIHEEVVISKVFKEK